MLTVLYLPPCKLMIAIYDNTPMFFLLM